MNYNFEIMNAAKKYLGLKEYPGVPSNPVIDRFFAESGFPGMTDEVPWCAAYIGGVLAECGLPTSNSLMARSYSNYGRKVERADARPGDIVVLERGKIPFGHVGFFVGYSGANVLLLGGNQSNAVTQAPFNATRIVAIRRADPSVMSGRPTLRIGDKGTMVLDLQTQLKKLGFHTGSLDSDFGGITDGSVRAFQAYMDLDADGVAGNRTWEALTTAKPRVRDVQPEDLKDSRIMKGAEKTELASVMGMVATGANILPTISKAIQEAEGFLEIGSRVLAQHWMLLLVVAALAGGIYYPRVIRGARLEDARTGAHLGR